MHLTSTSVITCDHPLILTAPVIILWSVSLNIKRNTFFLRFRFGTRFPAVTEAYDRELRRIVKEAAKELKLDFVKDGVYCYQTGPCFESVTESRLMRLAGVDVAGRYTPPPPPHHHHHPHHHHYYHHHSGPAPGIGDIGSRLGRQILGGANFRERNIFSDNTL